MQVPLARCSVGFDDPRPGGPAEDRLPVVRRQLAVLADTVAEHVAGALGTAGRRRQGGLEPHVLVRGVVRDQIDDHTDAAGMGALEHRVEVGKGAENGVDVAVVSDVVPGILLR